MINQFGQVDSIMDVGDVVQSLKVHNNKLFVIVNNSHKIMAYDISSNGLSLPGIEVNTENSSPREMVIADDKLYFTNWNSKDIKYLDLINYTVNTLVDLNGLPEDIIYKDNKLFFTINMNEDYSSSDQVISYDIDNRQYYSAPLGIYSDNIKISLYKLLIQKKYVENFKRLFNALKLNVE